MGREARKVVTVLFCDVVESTALGERLDPEAIRRVMQRYFEGMRSAVANHPTLKVVNRHTQPQIPSFSEGSNRKENGEHDGEKKDNSSHQTTLRHRLRRRAEGLG